MTIQEIIKNHVLGEMFSEFPKNTENAFDFFLRYEIDDTNFVTLSPLGEKWEYVVNEQYCLNNIKSLREHMLSMYDDLERLKSALFQHSTGYVKIYKDEMKTDSSFYETAQLPNAILKEQGTDDEYISFITVSEEPIPEKLYRDEVLIEFNEADDVWMLINKETGGVVDTGHSIVCLVNNNDCLR